MPVSVKDLSPNRSPTSPIKTAPTGSILEFIEADIPVNINLYVDTGYVDAGYVEGE